MLPPDLIFIVFFTVSRILYYQKQERGHRNPCYTTVLYAVSVLANLATILHAQMPFFALAPWIESIRFFHPYRGQCVTTTSTVLRLSEGQVSSGHGHSRRGYAQSGLPFVTKVEGLLQRALIVGL
eukprot:8730016-Pyramimonas_sp.AAC.2